MQKLYRLVFESYDPTNENELTKTVITKGIISNPVDLFSIGFSHEEQRKCNKISLAIENSV